MFRWVVSAAGAVILLFGSTLGTVAGQELFDEGIQLVGAISARGDAVQILSPGNDDEHCGINGSVLEAEAERTFRRDGLTAQPADGTIPSTVLSVSVTALAADLAGQRCVVDVTVQLMIISDTGLPPLLAAQGGRLMIWNRREYVARARAVVEETVSVIAKCDPARTRCRDGWSSLSTRYSSTLRWAGTTPWHSRGGATRRFASLTATGVGQAPMQGCPWFEGSKSARMVPWIPSRKVGIDRGMAVGPVAVRHYL